MLSTKSKICQVIPEKYILTCVVRTSRKSNSRSVFCSSKHSFCINIYIYLYFIVTVSMYIKFTNRLSGTLYMLLHVYANGIKNIAVMRCLCWLYYKKSCNLLFVFELSLADFLQHSYAVLDSELCRGHVLVHLQCFGLFFKPMRSNIISGFRIHL